MSGIRVTSIVYNPIVLFLCRSALVGQISYGSCNKDSCKSTGDNTEEHRECEAAD